MGHEHQLRLEIYHFGIAKNIKQILFFASIFLLTTMTAMSSNGESTKVSEAKEMLVFCDAVQKLNVGYFTALNKHQDIIEGSFSKVKENESGLTFGNSSYELSAHFGVHKDDMHQLERLYSSYATGQEEQKTLVSKVNGVQARIKKLNVFTKSYSDYVNSGRYLQDENKMSGQMIFDKLAEMSSQLKSEILIITDEVVQLKFQSEETCLLDHPMKSILEPMNEDMKFLSQVIKSSLSDADINSTIEIIKEKRTELASTNESRIKDVEFLLKTAKRTDQYKNFYLKFNAVLTKTENTLKKNNLDATSVRNELELNNVSLEQLEIAYNKLKENSVL